LNFLIKTEFGFREVAAIELLIGDFLNLQLFRPFLRGVHHGKNLDVVPKPIGDDVGNVGQYEFARAGDATDATSGRELCKHIYSSDEPGNHSCSGIRVFLNVGTDLIESRQRSHGPADAPLRHD
jgi:hypothetical protein